MATEYVMRATRISTSKHIYWSSIGSPDLTGALSGISPSDLSGIIVDYTTDTILPTEGSSPSSNGVLSGAVITVPNWYIDSVSGFDTNDGLTSGTPFKTFSKLLATWGSAPTLKPTGGTLTVHYLNSAPITDSVTTHLFDLAPDTVLVFKSESSAITTAASGTITSITTHSGNTPWKVTDISMTWTPHVGKRARITSGPRVGTIFGIVKDEGANVARITQPVIPSAVGAGYAGLTLSTVQAGDPYVIENFPNLYIGEVAGVGRHDGSSTSVAGAIYFENFYFRNAGLGSIEIRQTTSINFVDCRFEPTALVELADTALFDTCMFDGGLIAALGFISINAGGILAVNALIPGVAVDAEAQSIFSFGMSTIVQGGSVHASDGGFIQVLDEGLGVYDSPEDGIQVGTPNNAPTEASLEVLGRLFGSGNTGYGVRIGAGCKMLWDGVGADPYAGIVPTITGSLGDAAFGLNENKGWVFNPGIGQYASKAISLTWANISTSIASGGFGGSANHPQLGACILRANDTLDVGNSIWSLTASEIINASTTNGEASSKEIELQTSDSSAHTLYSKAIPSNSGGILDIEVLAIKTNTTVMMWWKKSMGYLNIAGTITRGTQRDVDSETIGTGTPTWTVALDDDGAGNARVQVNSQGDTVNWYILGQRMDIKS